MADQLQVLLSRNQFLSLANRAGFDLSEADLAQLMRRNLLRPCDDSFHALHLFVLVRYFEAVRPTRHPWAAVAPTLTLQDITQESRQCHEFVVQLIDEQAQPDTDAASQWASSVRTCAEKIDPFGPLADVAKLLGDRGRGELRGDGLLYVWLLELADGLDALSAAESSEPIDLNEPAASEPAASEPDADQPDADQPDADQPDADQPEPEPSEPEEEVQLTEEIAPVEHDEHDEPAFEADDEDDEVPNPFSRQGSEVTARTEDLQSRLDQLRSHDKEVARNRGQTPEKHSEAVTPSDDPSEDPGREAPENVHERIEELNRLRETYLAEQRWQDLAELYEDGIELFVEPVERQQVFLTLAMLYEVKLKQLGSAFERFVAAYREEGTSQAKVKAFEGLQRLGRQSSIQARCIGFLEEELSTDGLDDAHRTALQRLLALTLHSAGQWQRAFFTYTAFLAEADPSQVDERALDDLEKLAGSVDAEELGDFYADLFSHNLPDKVFEPMAVRAARHHADRGEIGLAMEYYERVLQRLPDHEIAFHSLAQLYEDAGRLARLIELYKSKIQALGEAAPASLTSELERIQALAQPAPASD